MSQMLVRALVVIVGQKSRIIHLIKVKISNLCVNKETCYSH